MTGAGTLTVVVAYLFVDRLSHKVMRLCSEVLLEIDSFRSSELIISMKKIALIRCHGIYSSRPSYAIICPLAATMVLLLY